MTSESGRIATTAARTEETFGCVGRDHPITRVGSEIVEMSFGTRARDEFWDVASQNDDTLEPTSVWRTDPSTQTRATKTFWMLGRGDPGLFAQSRRCVDVNHPGTQTHFR